MDIEESRPVMIAGVAVPAYIADFQHVTTYAEILEVMRSPDFAQGGTPERRLFLGDTLVMVEGEEHLERKKRLSTLFSKEAMAYYEGKLLDPVIRETMAELASKRDPDGLVRVEFVTLIRIMLHRISAGVVGVDGVESTERVERFRMLLGRLGEATTVHWTTGDKNAVVQRGYETLQTIVEEYLQPSLDRRRDLVRRFEAGEIAKQDLPRDILTMICLSGEDVRPGDGPFNAYVWRECALFMLGGTQTTAHTLPHVVVHLDEWVKAHPEDEARLREADFLRRAAAESLRLHQTAPTKFRVATKDLVLSTGRRVAKDETLILFTPPANREVEIFGADAAQFNPYRTTPAGLQPWGLGFGAGAHMCIGRSLVTGLQNRSDDETGTEGTMIKILKAIYAAGATLDPTDPPQRMTSSFHDAFASVPLILRGL
jgi:cytochrome P450